MLRVGLLGYGAVGRAVGELIHDGAAGSAEVVGALVRDPTKYGREIEEQRFPFVAELEELLGLGPDLVVEAGGHDAFRQHVRSILSRGIDVVALSVGALADPDVLAAVEAAATEGGSRLRVPSGAIAGLDAISAAAVGRIERVTHTVRKPPAALLDAAEASRVAAEGQPVELFVGRAREAVKLFPANVNVVAAVSLAGVGLDRTEARVIADPGLTRNTHEVSVSGEFGQLFVRIENEPSDNPKTGRIVAMSVVRSVRSLGESVVLPG